MKYKEMTDEEILECINKDEKYAIDALINRYKEFVKIKARSYFLVGADNDDVIQEGMIGLYKAIRDYNNEKQSSFKTFADLCINRQMITAIKSATRSKHTPLNNYISLDQSGNEEDTENISLIDVIVKEGTEPEKLLIDKENIKNIQVQIEKNLSPLERETLLRYLRGVKYTQIAEELNMPPKTIDNALQRIKAKLAKTLKV